MNLSDYKTKTAIVTGKIAYGFFCIALIITLTSAIDLSNDKDEEPVLTTDQIQVNITTGFIPAQQFTIEHTGSNLLNFFPNVPIN